MVVVVVVVGQMLLHGIAIVLAGEVLQVVLVLIKQSTECVFSDNIGHAILAGGQSGGVGARHWRWRRIGAAEAGGMLLRLQPQCGNARGHAAAHAGLGGGAIHIRIGGCCIRTGCSAHAHICVGQRGAHGAREH